MCETGSAPSTYNNEFGFPLGRPNFFYDFPLRSFLYGNASLPSISHVRGCTLSLFRLPFSYAPLSLSLFLSLSLSFSFFLFLSWRHLLPRVNSKTKGASFCVLFEKTTSLYRGVGCETNIKKPFFCGRAFVLVYRVVSEMSSMAETSVEISPMLGAQ